jgi:glycosyltransferase involved in cell wall biosynthesis
VRQHSILCLSHLRWKFVYQRPQHLLSRCARDHRVLFFEEPIRDARTPELALETTDTGVTIAVPHLPPGLSPEQEEHAQRAMIDQLVAKEVPSGRPVLWYYTPMALAFTDHVRARAIVYDCMDELSLFRGAPPELTEREKLLLGRADVVFTGGHALYEHKKLTSRHPNIHPMPSSVDAAHFQQARFAVTEPVDQDAIPHPRIGFYGVIDERMDLELLDQLAELRPDLQFVMIGPIVKIDPGSLPRRDNIHWLGGKTYAELPAYLAGWDAAMMPFARNESTRFISPTKTPEFLAAGRPVVSTSIRDVVTPYGREGLAWIADTASDFSDALDEALACDRDALSTHADVFLSERSWDRTWQEMWSMVERAMSQRDLRATGRSPLHSVPGATEPLAVARRNRA